jgi:signal recognition particle receptor subunit beta
MVVLNYAGGEINAKIVYYGPGLSGKTTNLEYIHEKTPAGAKGKMVSMKTQTDRTLFFDFLPLELGEINGYRTRFLLYTVPGQVYYNATRKLVLKGVDALVFVADSSRAKLDENLESLRNLEQNLNEHGLSLDTLPWVIQYNKRDTPDAMAVRDLDSRVNPMRVPTFEAVATSGQGVYDTFRGIATMVYRALKERLERGDLAAAPPEAAPEIVSPPRAPAPGSGRGQPSRAPSRARPAPPRDEPADAPHEENEHEFNSAVDMMLREVDPPAPSRSPSGSKAKPKSRHADPAPAKPPVPSRHPSRGHDSAPRSRGREPAPMPPDDFFEPRESFEAPAPEPAPRRPGHAPLATPARSESPPADDGLFESIPESPFDLELGRLPALDEAARASESARDEGPDEFVTDPMRRPSLADTQATTRAEVMREAPAAPVAAAEPTTLTLTVPVTLKRSQLRKASAVKLVVDLRLTDE